MFFDPTKTFCFFCIYFVAKVLCCFGIRTEEIQLTALKNFRESKALVVAAEKIPLNVPNHGFETWSLHMLDSRLQAVSLFSVVRRAKRETRKWPRAWLMARDGRGTKKGEKRGKPAHTPDTLHIQPLSCKLQWTNQKHFYCFLLKPIRDNLAIGFSRALDLSPLHAQKSSGSRLLLTMTNKLRLSCRKKGKFETLKGFGGLKIYLQT